jgi:parallel beta-helix repeat protein
MIKRILAAVSNVSVSGFTWRSLRATSLRINRFSQRMLRKIFKRRHYPAILFIFCSVCGHAQQRTLTAGMKISKSATIKKGVYKIQATGDTSRSVILIEGNNITIDFNNAELKGSNKMKSPDEFFGIAIRVRNGTNITIKNLKAGGYRVALLAMNVEKLTLVNCDLSYNYRPRLNSTQEKEDVSDWMSYHHNEHDEWLRYGAAIYLKDCGQAVVTGCKVTGGQNALMMSNCNDAAVMNNDFSFNSGIGIGLYRCNRNKVMYNRVIFNVRGYSHGVYNRGQDSAGILVYEQSSNNTFYGNNVTHGGDGFFLWAGQTTMDTGEGGCNDNLVSNNDFSYAPTNGIEVTFSRNIILRNRVFECDHGIWGGYSYDTRIERNQFRNNRVAIAIEHGQHNTILQNLFLRDKEAIRLWSQKEQPTDWGYAKYRDTRSAGYLVAINSFNGNPIVYTITRTDSLTLFTNSYSNCETVFKIDSSVTNIDSTEREVAESDSSAVLYRPPTQGDDPFKGSGKYAGRKNILVTEWGPYDFRSPIIWNTNPADTSGVMQFDLLGPKGKWTIKTSRGIDSISATKGTFPATITAKMMKGERTDIFIELVYTGEAFITPFGEKITAGKPYTFSFKKFFQPLDWEVLFYSLNTAVHDPIKTGSLFSPVEKKAPVKIEKVNKLDYAWWGGLKADQTYKQFMTVASATADIPPGDYELSVTWDDAVRIYLDDQLVLNEWNPSRYQFVESPHRTISISLTKGVHHFRVEHLELGGFAALSVRLMKK